MQHNVNELGSVEQTNDDATISKWSAVRYGYWEDPYLTNFVSKLPPSSHRKAPEIHLGYYARVKALWNMVVRVSDWCAKSDKQLQVINLGAGFDTLYWRLRDYLDEKYGIVKHQSGAVVHRQSPVLKSLIDVDLPEVTAKKCMAIRKSKVLLSRVAGDEEGEVRLCRTDLHCTDYHIVAADFTDTKCLEQKLVSECGLDFDVPTLFLAECVLIYIDSKKVTHFIEWIAKRFSAPTVFLNHEQLHMDDRFGRFMQDNLSLRGWDLPGVSACLNRQTQIDRFVGSGWSQAQCWTMNEAYRLLPQDEISRVEKLERLDEKELMSQLFEHYCITVAWKNGAGMELNNLEWW